MISRFLAFWKGHAAPRLAAPAFWNRFGLAAAAIVLAAGAWMRWEVPPLPVADPDTWSYVKPALTLLSGEGFIQYHGRDWLYSLWVASGLQLTGSFAGLVRLQQILGLLSGVLLIAVLRRWAGFLPVTALREALVAVLGTVALGLFFLRPQTLLFEVQLRPESIWTFFIFVQLLAILAYARARWVTDRPGRAMAFGTVAFALAYAVLLLKPSWAGASLVTALPIFIGVFGPRKDLLWRMLTPMVAAVATLLVLWLPPRIFFQRDQISEDRLPRALFTIHAKWILDHFEKKASRFDPAGDEGKFLQEFLPLFRTEFAHTMDEDSVYRQLGFDADYLRYRSPIFQWLKVRAGLSPDALNDFCARAYLGAWSTEPLGMTGKILNQFELFFLPDYATFYKRGIDFREKYEVTVEKLPLDLERLSPPVERLYLAARNGVLEGAKHKEEIPPILAFQDVARAVSFLFPFLVLLALAGLAVVLAVPSLHPLRLGAWLALLLYGAPAGNALTVSIIHALDVHRYRLSYAGPLLLAGAALAVFIILTAERLVKERLNRQKETLS